jgi:hypothetical protein
MLQGGQGTYCYGFLVRGTLCLDSANERLRTSGFSLNLISAAGRKLGISV